jgi:hypothetical protein
MKTLIICLLSGVITFSAIAQKPPVKFGEIPMEDMKMTSYNADSSASAVILVDYGEAYIAINASSASLNFERHVRIKILKKDGLSWADAQIPLYFSGSAEEKVSGLKAASYNLEGGKIVETKMSKDGVFKEKFNRNINLQKFTIPNVKEGSVIEYSYKVISDFLEYFPNWQFQHTIPVRHSEYWAMIPEFFVFQKYMQGYLSISDYEIKDKPQAGYEAKGHHWILKDVPAFKEEPYMTSETDYVSKINFALSHISFPNQPVKEIMGSWAKLNETLLESESFGKAITGNGFLKKKAEEITAGMTDPAQKVTAIYDYIRQNLEWNGTKDYSADALKKVFELRKGTVGDINLALASMLEKAGIEVNMVILSTRDHGFVRKEYPMSKQFNYVICAAMVGGKMILLDATEKYLPANVLPERCLNGQGLLISRNSRHGWIDLQSKAKSKTTISADLLLEEDGALKGKLNFTRDGYDALRMRKDFVTKGEESYLKDVTKSRSWQIEKSEFKDIKNIDLAAKESHDLSIQEHASVAGNVIYINPFVIAQLESNPFKTEKREYPVDFGSAVEKIYICKFTYPEGYTIDELPQSKVFMLPGNAARYLFNVAQNGNSIVVTSNMQINKNLFLQEEYANLREFYSQVLAKQAEQIVLKRK